MDWLNNQQPIGGDGVVVEIKENLFVKRKYERGRQPSSVWLFGDIERLSKKKFIVPLTGKEHNRSAHILIHLIKKYILPRTTIVSDNWRAYTSIKEDRYTHWIINHSEHFVDPENNSAHTKRRTFMEWTKQPEIKCEYSAQHFTRYLFILENYQHCHHQFFGTAVCLYKPQSLRRPSQAPIPVDEVIEFEVSPGTGPSTSD